MKTYHLALHCLADLRCSRDAIRDHWFFPYFITAALRISSCVNNQIRQTFYIYYGFDFLSLLCNSHQSKFSRKGVTTDFLNGKDVTDRKICTETEERKLIDFFLQAHL